MTELQFLATAMVFTSFGAVSMATFCGSRTGRRKRRIVELQYLCKIQQGVLAATVAERDAAIRDRDHAKAAIVANDALAAGEWS